MRYLGAQNRIIMPFTSVMLFILAVFLAAAITYFLYYFRPKTRLRITPLLAFLRFIALLAIFLLLVNPKYERRTYTIVKSDLVVLADNSRSVQRPADRDLVTALLSRLTEDTGLEDRFRVRAFTFGEEVHPVDSLDFDARATNITNALKQVKQLFPDQNGAVLLVSDGIQTLGEDYSFYGGTSEKPVYSIVLGDTTRYEDLRIDRVNLNNYAFLGNKYPLEVLVSYQGDNAVTTNLTIAVDGVTRFRRTLSLNSGDNTREVFTELEAARVGLKEIAVSLSTLQGERNTANNSRSLGLEIIDEQTRIALVSDIVHPDLRALKEAIESNEQRSVTILKPQDVTDPEEFDLFVLYQPNSRFTRVFSHIAQRGSPAMVVAGPKTDWQFLNKAQNSYNGSRLGTVEEVVPVLNPTFGIFDLGTFDVEGYPPLDVDLGEFLLMKPHDIILNQRIKGLDVGEPLLVLLDDEQRREALLLGEDLWKWRIQEYRNSQNFEAFDNLFGRIVRYLAATESKDRLTVDYEKNLQGVGSAKISARYFDEAYQFNPNATLSVSISAVEGDQAREIPMLLKNEFYEADISSLPAGDYSFTVQVEGEALSRQGRFKVLEYDLEQQLVSSDFRKLTVLADESGGKVAFPGSESEILAELREDQRFAPVRKSTQNIVSLIDFKILLAIIAAALAAEWFIRKYHGLI